MEDLIKHIVRVVLVATTVTTTVTPTILQADQVRDYHLKELPAQKDHCLRNGGSWQGTYCTGEKSSGASSNGGIIVTTLVVGAFCLLTGCGFGETSE